MVSLRSFRARGSRSPLARAALCACAAAITTGTAGLGDIHDVSAGAADGYAEIVIEFDAAPTAAAAAPSAEGIALAARGVIARPRRIEAAGPGLVRGLDVREAEGGVEVGVSLSEEAAAARAWIVGRAVHVAVQLGPSADHALAAEVVAPTPSTLDTEPADHAPSSDDAADALAASASADHPSDANAAAAPTADDAARSAVEPAPGHAAPVAPDPAAALGPQEMHAAGDADAGAAPATAAGSLGAAEPARAGALAASDRAGRQQTGDPDAADLARRDLSRPAVVFAGRLDEADCLAAEEGVRADPWNLDALRDYASCLAIEGQAAEAVTAFERLLTFAPDDAEAQLGLAAARHELGQADAAVAVYQRLLADAVSDSEAARLRTLMALSLSANPAPAH